MRSPALFSAYPWPLWFTLVGMPPFQDTFYEYLALSEEFSRHSADRGSAHALPMVRERAFFYEAGGGGVRTGVCMYEVGYHRTSTRRECSERATRVRAYGPTRTDRKAQVAPHQAWPAALTAGLSFSTIECPRRND